MTAPDPVQITGYDYQRRYGETAGYAGAWSNRDITEWPSDYWVIEKDDNDIARVHPAIVLDQYKVFGMVDTRSGQRLFALLSATPYFDIEFPDYPSGVDGIEPYVEVLPAHNMDEAIEMARVHAEADPAQ